MLMVVIRSTASKGPLALTLGFFGHYVTRNKRNMKTYIFQDK